MANLDPSQSSDLQTMLARLRGMSNQPKPGEDGKAAEPPAATAVAAPPAAPPAPKPAAPPPPKPVAATPPAPAAAPAAPAAAAPAPAAAAPAPPAAPPAPAAAPPAAPAFCPACQTPRKEGDEFCGGCGMVFDASADAAAAATSVIKDRYHLQERIWERNGSERFRGLDTSSGQPVSVVILRSPAGQPANGSPQADVELVGSGGGTWPTVAWEKGLIEKADHPALPKIIDSFSDNGFDYLVLEVPAGESLWTCWDDFGTTWEKRFGWLKEIAEAIHKLHGGAAIIEGLRPDLITIQADGHARLNDLSDLLPLPLPPNPPIRGTYYTAPELAVARDTTDFRADTYSFGGMLYALTLGVDLTEKDFDPKTGLPKSFIARFPDVHPLMGKLVSKTFCRDPQLRYPTDGNAKTDPTGWQEIINVLETGRISFDTARLEIASWTTTGIVRTGNEDGFALIHATESILEDISEFALLILCDGMGGYEAGELAARMCIQTLRSYVLKHPMFAALRGEDHPERTGFNAEAIKKLFYDALKEANRVIYEAPMQKPPIGKRGMGCTADIVYIDGRNLVVGHVGDSRVYQLQDGKLNQVTRDQTLVNRLVELGQITAEDAENHPRKNELQQAVGGRKDVEPATYATRLKAGDWVLVTSDGLTGHVKNDELQEMFQLEAVSAEQAARRLINFANLRNSTDNCTVIVVRVT